jgi:DNA gyrase subunit B
MHEEGFKTALTRVVNNYAKDNRSRTSRTRTSPATTSARASPPWSRCACSEPQFEGQTKAKLGNTRCGRS